MSSGRRLGSTTLGSATQRPQVAAAFVAAALVAAALVAAAAPCAAAEPEAPADAAPAAAEPETREPPAPPAMSDLELSNRFQKLSAPPGGYGRILLGLSFGEGLRFNNPYRLRTPLGASAESVSFTAPYLDVHLGLAFGAPDGLQHGGRIGLAAAVRGVGQQALSVSYLLLYRGDGPLMPYARAGLSVLTAPDANVGGELAAGGAYFFTGALGLSAELVGNLFYGAGTYDRKYTAYPVLSLELGLLLDLEVLP